MTRPSGRSTLGALGVLLLLGLLLHVFGAAGSTDVATMTVARGRFVRHVTALGMLRAAKTTPVTAPVESMRSMKVASLVTDGSAVQAGEVVVRFDPYDAQKEAADGRADAGTAEAKLEHAGAEGEKTGRARVLDRDLAREDLKRAEEFVLTDEGIFSRNQRIESEIDRDLQKEHLESTTAWWTPEGGSWRPRRRSPASRRRRPPSACGRPSNP